LPYCAANAIRCRLIAIGNALGYDRFRRIPHDFASNPTAAPRSNADAPRRAPSGVAAPGAHEIARAHERGTRAAKDGVALEVAASLDAVSPNEWNALAGEQPFLRHEFLHALHETGCASPKSGWGPQFLLLREGGSLAAAMPLYLKGHSYGEYVFDWSWADAYQRHGLEYYPKLLCAVPFTPVAGVRLLATSDVQRRQLVEGAFVLAGELGVSSLHCLFPLEQDAEVFSERGMMMRSGVQFHWQNAGFGSFDDFLAAMNHDKRKKIKQERRKVAEADITFEWREGGAIRDEDWSFFYRCYARTYREHHSTPYLNLAFFRRIGETMPENLVMVIASRAGRPIAASFNMRDSTRLYGRYWGALEHHPVLHFETCYYQVIEYCIARGIAVFEGGAQGRHKIARGLLPVETRSAHWIARRDFASAIENFLARETEGMAHQIDELSERTPFKAL
jgi:predicted N-acyltransferase